MNKKSLIRELERQFEESRQNFREGKCIPLEDFEAEGRNCFGKSVT